MNDKKPKKSLARDLKLLKAVRAQIQVLVADGRTPKQIVKAIREDSYVEELLHLAGDKKPKTFDPKVLAAAILKPWLPEKIANAVLGQLFRLTQIDRSLRRFEDTLEERFELVDWARRGGIRLSYLEKPKEGQKTKSKTFGESAEQWRQMARLMPSDGFYTMAPPRGYKRPGPDDQALDWSVSQLYPALRAMVEKDSKVERILRSHELRLDPKDGAKLREACLLIIQGWIPITAIKQVMLQMPKTTFLANLRDPVLCGMEYDRSAEVRVLKTDLSILSGQEFVLLQTRIPPRGGKHLFGLVWENGSRVADPEDEEVWMVDIIYTMHIEQQLGRTQPMGLTRISRVTGLGRDVVRKMFERAEYKAIVGEDRFNQAHEINAVNNFQAKIREPKSTLPTEQPILA